MIKTGLLHTAPKAPAVDVGHVLRLLENTRGIVSGLIVDTTTGAAVDTFESPFFTALVWDELLDLIPRSLVFYSAVEFLESSGSVEEGWKFFPNGEAYPPDADDTAVVGRLLLRLERLADVTSLLDRFAANWVPNVGHYVWFKPRFNVRHDETIDPLVDCNITLLLQEFERRAICPELYRPYLRRDIPLWVQSAYYDDPAVRLWFRSRLDRHVSTVRFSEQEVTGLLDMAERVTRHPNLLDLVARTYGVMKPGLRERKLNDGPQAGWWFRHTRRPIGYACPLLDLVILAKLSS